ncbi:MAG TPA: FG-GAP-like repeat-containing protein [Candidatus Limnocylindrales bacterium]
MTFRETHAVRRVIVASATVALTAALLVAVTPARPALADVANGALIYQAGNNEGHVNVYRANGTFSHDFESGMNGGDQFVTGDVDGDGVEEIVVLGLATGGLDIFEDTGQLVNPEPYGTLADDGDKLAAGDIDGDGKEEILIAGDVDGIVEVYNNLGDKIDWFDSVFDGNDYLAAGDVDGDGKEEIVILGDGNGDAYVYLGDGTPMHGFCDTGYNDDDNFALGDVNGDGIVEILIAGDVAHKIDVMTHECKPVVPSFPTTYDTTDGFAAGDVNGDGKDEVLVAEDSNGDIDIYNFLGHPVGWIDNSGFDDDDFLAVGGSPDVDSDGIPNSVERFGVRKPDGTFGFRPQDHGASPCRPDVFVKVDYMASTYGLGGHQHQPADSTLQLVKDAFNTQARPAIAKCPFPNWTHIPGVQLVTLPGEEVPHRELLSPSGDRNDRDDDFSDIRDGTNLHNNNPGGPDRLPDDWRPFVHYALFAHRQYSTNENVDPDGVAFGKDFVVSLGGGTVGGGGGPQLQAATFMHELGHALGLEHGGFEEVNFKPNYLSVMNYAFPRGLLPGDRLDFSTGIRPDLDQQHLNEAEGIGDATVTTGFYDETRTLVYKPGKPLNFDGGPAGELDVEADINGDNGGTCVSPGPDGMLSTNPDPNDGKAVPPQTSSTPELVIHAGSDYVCNTDAARGQDGELLDKQDRPSGTHTSLLRDHNDWTGLNFRVKQWTLGDAVPAELTSAQIAAIVATQDQSVYPDKTLSFGAPPAGTELEAVAVAHDARRVYVTWSYHPIGNPHGKPYKGELIVLDRARLQVIKRIPVGQEPRSVAVNPITNKIYVVNYGPESYNVSVIDGASLTVKATIATGQAPIDVAVNTRTNRVYVSVPYQQKLAVIDGATDTMLPPITVGNGPTELTVDEATSTIQVALSHWSSEPFVNGLGTVYDTGTTTVVYPPVPIPDRTQPWAIAVDENRIYVGNLGGGTVHPTITVFDKATRTIVTDMKVPGPVRSLGIDRQAGLLLASTERGVFTIDTQSLKILRVMQKETPMWTISVGTGLGREFYVGNRLGDLLRLSYSSGTPVTG